MFELLSLRLSASVSPDKQDDYADLMLLLLSLYGVAAIPKNSSTLIPSICARSDSENISATCLSFAIMSPGVGISPKGKG